MMTPAHTFVSLVLAVCALGGCGADTPEAAGRSATELRATSAAIPATQSATLRMQIDGQAWLATHDVFAAVHPAGYDRAIVIAGSLGKQASHEQAFTLNLYGIDKPGRYPISSASIDKGVIQFSDFSAQRHLMGGALGYDGIVELIAFSANPSRVEARFEGSLISNDNAKVTIRDGYINYAE